MNTGIHGYKNEFLGEILKYCMDREYIWFYDEISGGLYRLNRINRVVEMVLTPMEIHSKKIFPIRQILKWKDEIYIIPNDISHEWLIYNIVNRRLRSVLLYSKSYEIGNVINIGEWLYLIPEKTNQILAIVEAGTLHVKMIIADWYKNDSRELECWGYSAFEDIILFPIIGTEEIFQIQGERITELPLHIKQPIHSISLCKNEIWILPNRGNAIFCTDRSGEYLDSVKIQTSCYEDIAERFARIIAVDKYVYLLPKQGGEILVLGRKNKEWTAIGEKDEPLYRFVYQKTKSVPYWGCYYTEGKLYTLPLQYRFAEINPENKSMIYKVLQCAATLTEEQYTSYVCWMNEKAKINLYVEWEKNSLRDFWDLTLEHRIYYNRKSVGKKIWMTIENT